jgi:hypothetical protein
MFETVSPWSARPRSALEGRDIGGFALQSSVTLDHLEAESALVGSVDSGVILCFPARRPQHLV